MRSGFRNELNLKSPTDRLSLLNYSRPTKKKITDLCSQFDVRLGMKHPFHNEKNPLSIALKEYVVF